MEIYKQLSLDVGIVEDDAELAEQSREMPAYQIRLNNLRTL